MLDTAGRLITPAQMDGTGVDAFVSTLSAGPTLKTAVMGLLSDVSVASSRRLAETCYTRIVDSTGLGDPRATDIQIDNLIRLQPDGCYCRWYRRGPRSVQKMIESWAFILSPSAERRPAVLFAGNQRLQDQVKDLLGNGSVIVFRPKCPTLFDMEDLDHGTCCEVVLRSESGNFRESELDAWSGGTVLPLHAEGRMIRFLTAVYEILALGFWESTLVPPRQS
jgi:hypothetical protein